MFHNLRSTRQTELREKYPDHVVCTWIGNSRAVAAKHYLQTTDEHYESAAKEPTGALQKALQKPADDERRGADTVNSDATNSQDFVTLRQCSAVSVGDAGLEPATSTL